MKRKAVSLLLVLSLFACMYIPAAAYSEGRVGYATAVSATDWFSAFVDNDGGLWMAGRVANIPGLTQGDRTVGVVEIQSVPVKVMDNVVSVSCGDEHGGALKSDGTLWMWGRNNESQVGNGGEYEKEQNGSKYQGAPVMVLDQVSAFSCGEYCTAAIRTDGSLWMWGAASGIPGSVAYSSPEKVMEDVVSVSCGEGYGAAVKTDGSLWVWGHLGGLFQTETPVQWMDGVSTVSCGRNHLAIIKADGSLWMAGNNYYGQLGNGTVSDNSSETIEPVKVMDDVMQAWAGIETSAAVKTDGTLWTWGENDRAVLGNGEAYAVGMTRKLEACVLAPRQIMENVAYCCLTGVLGAGFAIDHDGVVWAWGYGGNGVLGNGYVGDMSYSMSGPGTTEDNWVPLQTAPSFVMSLVDPSDRTVRRTEPDEQDPADPDHPSRWAIQDIHNGIGLEIVPEHLQGAYRQSTTRAEFCALAVALYEGYIGEISERIGFTDTNDPNVEKMAALGVVNGVGGGLFSPDSPLTREQAATMLARLAKAAGKDIGEYEPDFADRDSISSWALEAVGQMQGSGVMNGTGDNYFTPKGSYTREQSIATMVRLLFFIFDGNITRAMPS